MSVKEIFEEIYNEGFGCYEDFDENILKNRNFIPFYIPFIKYTLKKIDKNIPQSVFWRRETINDIARGVFNRLEPLCIRTLILEIKFCKENKVIQASDIKIEYEIFLQECLKNLSYMEGFWRIYPLLLCEIVEACNEYVLLLRNMVERLEKDRKEIIRELCNGKEFEMLVRVESDMADFHDYGETVVKIVLDNGITIYYKPQKNNLKKIYLEYLKVLYKDQKLDSYDYKIVFQSKYSWEKEVYYKECATETEIKNYFTRLGINLFLCYAIGAADIHYENVIAAGEFPVLIDMEVIKRNKNSNIMRDIEKFMSDSVLNIGILPVYMKGTNNSVFNAGILRNEESCKTIYDIPVVANSQTSDIRITYKKSVVNTGQCLPKINGKGVKLEKYLYFFIKGFYNSFCIWKNRRLEKKIKVSLKKENFRYILRATQEYSMILLIIRNPEYLCNKEKRNKLVDLLLQQSEEYNVQIIEYEKKCLLKGNIPYFSHNFADYNLYCEDAVIQDYFSNSIELRGRNKKENILNQIRLIIVASNGLLEGGVKNTYIMNKLLDLKQYTVDNSKSYIDLAIDKMMCRIMKNNLLAEEKSIGWWSIETIDNIWNVVPMNNYLYCGMAGMCILFHIYYLKNPIASIKTVIKQIDEQMFCYTKSLSNDKKEMGAFTGEYSIVYMYQYVYTITKNEIYLHYAEQHCSKLLKMDLASRGYDFVSGWSGIIKTLLNMYKLTNNEKFIYDAEHRINLMIEEIEAECNLYDRGKSNRMWAGLAHGLSGAEICLCNYQKITKRDKYMKYISKMIEYENKLYDSKIKNWKDIRGINSGDGVAWCHGAAGILLARTVLQEKEEIKDICKKDIEKAMEKIMTKGLRKGFCLCHGNSGNVHIMLESALKQGNDKIVKICEIYLHNMAKKIYENKLELLPQERFDFGLMNGIAGFIYALLSRKVKLPEILLLDI